MKIILAIIAFTFALQVNAQEQTVKKETAKKEKVKKTKGLSFTTLEINRENIPYNSDELFIFEFKNDTKTPATISSVQTSCGCTAAEKPTEPVKPGKKSQISVKYDTKRVGPFTKTITVMSDVSEPIILTIKGTVLAEEQK